MCKSTCLTLVKRGDEGDSDKLDSMLGDMRACAQEYYALGAQDYDKLEELTDRLAPEFDNMLDAIDQLSETPDEDAAEELKDAVTDMCSALKVMY